MSAHRTLRSTRELYLSSCWNQRMSAVLSYGTRTLCVAATGLEHAITCASFPPSRVISVISNPLLAFSLFFCPSLYYSRLFLSRLHRECRNATPMEFEFILRVIHEFPINSNPPDILRLDRSTVYLFIRFILQSSSISYYYTLIYLFHRWPTSCRPQRRVKSSTF